MRAAWAAMILVGATAQAQPAGAPTASERQAAWRRDEARCFEWARRSTGIDPIAEAGRAATEPPSPTNPSDSAAWRSATFSRAWGACLASLGYPPL